MKIKMIIAILLLIISLNISAQSTKPKAFLDKYEDVTVELMKEYNIPASVILGVSMLESGYGTSNVSQTKNNYFGVRSKKDGIWDYKKYEQDIESFDDFCKVLERKKYYRKLTTEKVLDYKTWVDNIDNAGYAESEHWHPRVLSIVRKYELYKIDEKINEYPLRDSTFVFNIWNIEYVTR